MYLNGAVTVVHVPGSLVQFLHKLMFVQLRNISNNRPDSDGRRVQSIGTKSIVEISLAQLTGCR